MAAPRRHPWSQYFVLGGPERREPVAHTLDARHEGLLFPAASPQNVHLCRERAERRPLDQLPPELLPLSLRSATAGMNDDDNDGLYALVDLSSIELTPDGALEFDTMTPPTTREEEKTFATLQATAADADPPFPISPQAAIESLKELNIESGRREKSFRSTLSIKFLIPVKAINILATAFAMQGPPLDNDQQDVLLIVCHHILTIFGAPQSAVQPFTLWLAGRAGTGKTWKRIELIKCPPSTTSSPSTTTFQVKTKSLRGTTTTITICRTGFQIIPSLAFTVYKAQGLTIHHAILDLSIPPGPFDSNFTYIMNSWTFTPDGIAILQSFDPKILTLPPPNDVDIPRPSSTYGHSFPKHTSDCN
ncbi:hypothetical protein BDK51DRAFT_27268 [Blyttiomyces helicus]|uniref:Uncharacterized protein n=1 Tax=Blyttiomyces helicus TaxID=388810 RepID=A0A4V1IS98_9FUNG|nr:hypothetical protein BDK51DRAFT_27268 [Blyttiomyces helicus]|eukprot:RKO92807.1 hypothetical protein BDK51DRAFT_27268 [Blyttiomyces helicus]